MSLCNHDNGIEHCQDNDGDRKGCIPVIADVSRKPEQMFENEIGQTDKWVMETNDDQCTDGEIDDDICFVPIQKQTAVKGPEQK